MYQSIENFVSERTKEDIEKVEDMAYKLMSVRDIAILLGYAPAMLTMVVRDEVNAVAEAYYRGKARRVLEMHEQEIELAGSGSAQAMENLHGFLNKMEAAEE